MDSPLRQQTRPDVFKPKVVDLYETLFQDEQAELSEGFWREFFLLKPDPASLHGHINRMSPEHMLHTYQHVYEQLFLRATDQIRREPSPSTDIALDTLIVFLDAVLNKRYGNPAADIISVLAGLDDVDAIFSDFVAVLEGTIRTGKTVSTRIKAVRVAIITIAGTYNTALSSYFISRDIFPSLTKLVRDFPSTEATSQVTTLLGLLLNYQKGEFLSPYRTRIEDFANVEVIGAISTCYAALSDSCRDQYITIQDDAKEGWAVGGTLSWLSLGMIASKPQSASPMLSTEQAEAAFAALPPHRASSLLFLYDFTLANKVMRLEFVTKASTTKDASTVPFASFLSFSSYLYQHAFRSAKAAAYACTSLLILQVLLSDLNVAGGICGEQNVAPVRICRQKVPMLSTVKADRNLAAATIDAVTGGLSHNMRKRLDVELYTLFLSTLIRVFTYLGITRTKIAYNYTPLWSSLFTLLRFFASHSGSLSSLPSFERLLHHLLLVILMALTSGEQFLPTDAAYDDLVYKLSEAADMLHELREAYSSMFAAGSIGISSSDHQSAKSSLDILLAVVEHCKLLTREANGGKGLNTSAGPGEMSKVIRQGYEGLQAVMEDHKAVSGSAGQLAGLELYKESEWRTLIKRIGRIVVQDARAGVMEEAMGLR